MMSSRHCQPIATLEGFTRTFHIVGRATDQRESVGLHDVVASQLLATLSKDDNARLLVVWDGDDALRPDSFITVFLMAVKELIGMPLLARITFVYCVSPTSPWPKEEAPELIERIEILQAQAKSIVASPLASTESIAGRLGQRIQDLKGEVNESSTDVAVAIRESFELADGAPLVEDEDGRLPHEKYGSAGYGLLALAVSRLLGSMGEFTKVTDLEKLHGLATAWIGV